MPAQSVLERVPPKGAALARIQASPKRCCRDRGGAGLRTNPSVRRDNLLLDCEAIQQVKSGRGGLLLSTSVACGEGRMDDRIGARMLRATLRVLFWGAAAMAITAGVGYVFGVSA